MRWLGLSSSDEVRFRVNDIVVLKWVVSGACRVAVGLVGLCRVLVGLCRVALSGCRVTTAARVLAFLSGCVGFVGLCRVGG